MRDRVTKRRNNNIVAGLILLAIGGVWLVKQLGFFIPGWLFTWPMILIIVGIFVGLKNNFQDFGWLIMVSIGAIFLVDKWYPEFPVWRYMVPGIIIAVGLCLIFVPRRKSGWDWNDRYRDLKDQDTYNAKETSTATTTEEQPGFRHPEEQLDIVSVFSGFKKMVYSKNFGGGDVVCIFGGADVDLSQADFKGIIIIDLVHIFGGSKIIVPPNWEVRTEAAVIFGGVEDKRRTQMTPYDKDKLVILKGAIIFGGVELRSY